MSLFIATVCICWRQYWHTNSITILCHQSPQHTWAVLGLSKHDGRFTLNRFCWEICLSSDTCLLNCDPCSGSLGYQITKLSFWIWRAQGTIHCKAKRKVQKKTKHVSFWSNHHLFQLFSNNKWKRLRDFPFFLRPKQTCKMRWRHLTLREAVQSCQAASKDIQEMLCLTDNSHIYVGRRIQCI